jgi:hypothetical protein
LEVLDMRVLHPEVKVCNYCAAREEGHLDIDLLDKELDLKVLKPCLVENYLLE